MKKAIALMTAALTAMAMPMLAPVPRLESEGWEAAVDEVPSKAETRELTSIVVCDVDDGEIRVTTTSEVIVICDVDVDDGEIRVTTTSEVIVICGELLVRVILIVLIAGPGSESCATTMHDKRRERKTLADDHFMFVGEAVRERFVLLKLKVTPRVRVPPRLLDHHETLQRWLQDTAGKNRNVQFHNFHLFCHTNSRPGRR
jgi:hypothetical protein